MSSGLRKEITFSTPVAAATHKPTAQPPQKKQKMTVTQTYYLAHTARGKLSSEAARGDHDLRLLVGHANLLDSLMLEIQDAEKEQEAWFNQTVRNSTKQEPRRVQWTDSIIREEEGDEYESDSDSDSDYDDYADDEQEDAKPLRRVRSPPPAAYNDEESDSEDEYDDDEDDLTQLALTRTISRVPQPPELVHDSDDSSDDESPPSPPQPAFELEGISSLDYGSKKPQSQKQPDIAAEDALIEDGFFIPDRQQPTMIASAC